MEDNKLTEFEEKIWGVVVNTITDRFIVKNKTAFITDLRQIMPPTCTKNERKFLDEIREKGGFLKYSDGQEVIDLPNSVINQKDFDSNLPELVEKKDE